MSDGVSRNHDNKTYVGNTDDKVLVKGPRAFAQRSKNEFDYYCLRDTLVLNPKNIQKLYDNSMLPSPSL